MSATLSELANLCVEATAEQRKDVSYMLHHIGGVWGYYSYVGATATAHNCETSLVAELQRLASPPMVNVPMTVALAKYLLKGDLDRPGYDELVAAISKAMR
jgi:hypothetical protein